MCNYICMMDWRITSFKQCLTKHQILYATHRQQHQNADRIITQTTQISEVTFIWCHQTTLTCHLTTNLQICALVKVPLHAVVAVGQGKVGDPLPDTRRIPTLGYHAHDHCRWSYVHLNPLLVCNEHNNKTVMISNMMIDDQMIGKMITDDQWKSHFISLISYLDQQFSDCPLHLWTEITALHFTRCVITESDTVHSFGILHYRSTTKFEYGNLTYFLRIIWFSVYSCRWLGLGEANQWIKFLLLLFVTVVKVSYFHFWNQNIYNVNMPKFLSDMVLLTSSCQL